ncbi:MAG TPA: hypothetical protein VKX17_00660, partial [Planctomycetota bacterium]|nr:hypothetical protein [Planctomycetota bacterium]
TRADEAESAPPTTLRGQLDRAFEALDKQPWYLQWLLPAEAPSLARVAWFYPLIGGECAVALVEQKDDAGATSAKHLRDKGVLVFLRVSGSRGHLARLGAAIFHPQKNVEIFDLGGGLIAIGFNGARPAFEPHAPPMVVSAFSEDGAPPLIRAAYNSKAPPPRKKEEFPDTTNPSIAQLFEDGAPNAVLHALQTPPSASEMLNCKAPPVLTRVSVFASPDGMLSVRGRIDGDVPPLPAHAANGDAIPARSAEPFSEFSTPDVVADLVLPLDLRACFLRHAAGGMKLEPNAPGRTKDQRTWIHRFNTLANERVDLDKELWPAFGHAAVLEIHAPEANTGTGLGKVKLWMPFRATAGTVQALTALARARWVWVIEQGETLDPKPLNYVTHFHSDDGESFVLSDKINAPAWNVGPKGFRLVSDAGFEAVRDGPRESSFSAPPASLNAYRLRLDGPRMASTVESYVVYDYDERMEDLGPQKFVDQCPHRDRDVRLARKWSSLIGRFELEIAPDTTGADVRLNWKPASLNAAVSRDAPAPAKETKDSKKEKKLDDDDVPPPPPGN